jgi:multidrug efflux pump subunit AcrB
MLAAACWPRQERRPTCRPSAHSRRFFDWLQARYARGLDWALHHRGPVLLPAGRGHPQRF